jgi:hypothetical protein
VPGLARGFFWLRGIFAAITRKIPRRWKTPHGNPLRRPPEAGTVSQRHCDRHQVQCACGRTHAVEAPPEAAGAPGTVTYGLNFQAWCVFLMVMHHVPVERCADIIASMSGTRPSDRRVHALLERAARAVAAANTGDPGADHP